MATLTYLLIGAAIFDTIESEEERNQFSALQCKYIHLIGQNRSQSQVFIRAAFFDTIASEEEKNRSQLSSVSIPHWSEQEPITGLHQGGLL